MYFKTYRKDEMCYGWFLFDASNTKLASSVQYYKTNQECFHAVCDLQEKIPGATIEACKDW